MSNRTSKHVKFFIDKQSCPLGPILEFSESARSTTGISYHITLESGESFNFGISFFNHLLETPDRLFIGRAWVAEAIAAGLTVGCIPNEDYFHIYNELQSHNLLPGSSKAE